MGDRNANQIGDRLRAVRTQKRLSLHEVERATQKEFKASVLGAYERGERVISVPRLQRLAEFYGVPVDRMLPLNGTEDAAASPRRGPNGICIDLTKLDHVQAPEVPALGRYVTMIQRARGDFNGRVVSLRDEDVRALAAVLETTPETFAARLNDLGLRASLR